MTAISAPQNPFIKLDTTTQGDWTKWYGLAGFAIAGELAELPAWIKIVISGQAAFVWDSASTDPRALRHNSTRIAAAWIAPEWLTIDVDLQDGEPHDVAIYCLDWDSTARRQIVEVVDASGEVIDRAGLAGFHNGQYLVWSLTGKFTIRITPLVGNAVFSGIFFG